jgi:hypothetical protein
MIVNKATARIAVPTAISSNMEARGCLAIVTSTGLQLFAAVEVLTPRIVVGVFPPQVKRRHELRRGE